MFVTDAVLVERSLHGDRQAFGEIVRRYQSLVCSIAYSATGSLEVSEELAQEAFLSAWRSLPSLKDAEKLRPWLCGVIRNLANDRNRRARRDVLQDAVRVPIEAALLPDHGTPDPTAESIALEEVELLNRTLASLPEIYREPLVLYHREEQSIARVAELLELNPNTVKQRLARGRELLKTEMAALVERGLSRSAPGRNFTIAVLAAIPAMTASAQAAAITATTVKGTAFVKATTWTGMASALAGPLLGMLGGWYGYKMSLRTARSERERDFIRFSTKLIVALSALGLLFCLLAGLGINLARTRPYLFASLITGGAIVYTSSLASLIVWIHRRTAEIRREEGTDQPLTQEQLAAMLPPVMRTTAYPRRYDSPWKLLGIPLVSVRFRGAKHLSATGTTPAFGWIAIGDVAIGVLFASGGMALGGIAFGGMSAGLISIGGMGIGVMSLAGLALGWWANGGIAVGVYAFGGLSLAWKMAVGGVAVAKEVALGGIAMADQENTEQAKTLVTNHPFFSYSMRLTSSLLWITMTVCGLLPMLLAMWLVPPNQQESKT